MYRLVMDLLTLTRLEGGTADLQYGRVDLGLLLAATTAKLSPQAAQAGVELAYTGGNVPAIDADGDRLAQVFSNLIDNALKFTPPGGRVSVQVKDMGTHVQVEVADTGKGIAVDEQERIFERFYQTETSRGGGGDHGAGLGLPIARQIVIAHQGTLWVESRPGLGSRFFVQLPRERSTAKATNLRPEVG